MGYFLEKGHPANAISPFEGAATLVANSRTLCDMLAAFAGPKKFGTGALQSWLWRQALFTMNLYSSRPPASGGRAEYAPLLLPANLTPGGSQCL